MKVQTKTNIAGRDFPSPFDRDLFSLRRSGTAFASGNPYDPESLLTGEEAKRGLTYDNSRRDWPAEWVYQEAVAGNLTQAEILESAPRVLLNEDRGIERFYRVIPEAAA